MGWRKHKPSDDPFEARSRELADQIRKLEKQISQLAQAPAPPAPKAQATSSGPAAPQGHPSQKTPVPLPAPPTPIPVQPQLPAAVDGRINPQGIRKFDLASLWRRVVMHFKGPHANNPRMVQYLAAGSVHGLRPLRYEKRVARNRFIGLFLLLILILFGLARVYFPQR